MFINIIVEYSFYLPLVLGLFKQVNKSFKPKYTLAAPPDADINWNAKELDEWVKDILPGTFKLGTLVDMVKAWKPIGF